MDSAANPLIPYIKATRSLTSLLGKLRIGKDKFYRDPRDHMNFYRPPSGVKPRPPALSTFPVYGLGLKEAKDWVERYLARNVT